MDIGAHDPPLLCGDGSEPVNLLVRLAREHVVQEDGELYSSQCRNAGHVRLIMTYFFYIHQQAESVGRDVLVDSVRNVLNRAAKSLQVRAVGVPAAGLVAVRLPGAQVGLSDALDLINRVLDISSYLNMPTEILVGIADIRREVERGSGG